MSENNTYRVIELVGTSPDGVDAAIESGIERAAATLQNLRWFEVRDIRGHIEDGEVAHYQVTMRVGFTLKPLEEAEEEEV
jgi:hypothetical protein